MPSIPPIPEPIEHAGRTLVFIGFGMPVGIVERLVGRRHRINDEGIDLALFLRLHPVVGL
jgi:hypothetical protein